MVKVLSVLVLSGCSFVFMHSPNAEREPACPEQLEAPVTDTVIAGLAAGAIAAAAIDAASTPRMSCVDCSPGYEVYVVAYYAAPIALAYAASALYGFETRRACKEWNASHPAEPADGAVTGTAQAMTPAPAQRGATVP